MAVLAAVPLVLGALTYERNNTWRSRMTLWEDVVRKGPGAPRAYVNLGFYYSDELKDREKAIRYYREALRLDPRADDARINLGIVYLERNELDKARYHLGIALKYYPQNTRAHCMMGVALGKMGQLDRAIEHLD
ncbi:MAG: tetratricopeptide repeat protein, partial [Anaerolineae bacterium]|nr:tetratricopeptide repeat protein [Anaerolineae bacterium]